MKKLCLVSATLLSCLASAANADKLTGLDTVKKGEGAFEQHYISLTALNKDSSLPKIKKEQHGSGKSGDQTLAPADPLTYVEVDYVGSSTQGWEPIAVDAFSTSKDHGGATLLVRVIEVGYGTNPIAEMNGSILSSSKNYENTRLCWNFSGYLTFDCQAGMLIAGYARYYDLSGNQSGTFEYQNTSINSPWNTEYDRLYIQ